MVQIKLRAIKRVKVLHYYTRNEEICIYYYINLEEAFENSDENKTLIKMVKQYKDFICLTRLINNLHCNFGYQEINLPLPITNEYDVTPSTKENWDEYLEQIRMSPRIEENESFKEFFCLNRIGDRFKYQRKVDEIEIFDFTH